MAPHAHLGQHRRAAIQASSSIILWACRAPRPAYRVRSEVAAAGLTKRVQDATGRAGAACHWPWFGLEFGQHP